MKAALEALQTATKSSDEGITKAVANVANEVQNLQAAHDKKLQDTQNNHDKTIKQLNQAADEKEKKLTEENKTLKEEKFDLARQEVEAAEALDATLQKIIKALPASCVAQEQCVNPDQNKYLIQLKESVANIVSLYQKAQNLEQENAKLQEEKAKREQAEKEKDKPQSKIWYAPAVEFCTKYQKHLIGTVVSLVVLLGLVAASRTSFGMNFLSSASTTVGGWRENLSAKIFGAKEISVRQPNENLGADMGV